MLKPPSSRPLSFTARSNGLLNVLTTRVYISDPLLTLPSHEPDEKSSFLAIWDTGATNTVITERVVEVLGLKPTGKTLTCRVGGTDQTDTYLVSVWLPNKVIFPALRVTGAKSVAGADVLIGMDIIGAGDFAVTCKDGKTVFSYRLPSMTCIDFVAEAKSDPAFKQGRNDPCSCGSGKKYKKCCGK